MKKILNAAAGFALILTMLSAGMVQTMFASSHQEAPFIARDRYADNTDTYAFRSIGPDRDDYVTFIANYIPFQQPSGGPHFFRWDDTVLYEIRVDNTGDGVEDIVYQFQFTTRTINGDTVLGQGAANKDIAIKSNDDADYNIMQTLCRPKKS